MQIGTLVKGKPTKTLKNKGVHVRSGRFIVASTEMKNLIKYKNAATQKKPTTCLIQLFPPEKVMGMIVKINSDINGSDKLAQVLIGERALWFFMSNLEPLS